MTDGKNYNSTEEQEQVWSQEAIDEMENGMAENEELIDSIEDPEVYVPAVQAVLFALGRAVSSAELGKACFCSTSTAKKAARKLQEQLDESDAGIIIREFDGLFQMCSNPAYYENLIRLVSAPKKPVLTDVVMETLAIIAYKSPATKVEIEKIRGVSSDHAVNRLIEYGLVEEAGRLDAPGRPVLFAPTQEFYRRFGVSGKSDMPVLSPDMEAIISDEVETEVRETMKVEV